MTDTLSELEIVRPDDWHLHLRDGAVLRAVLSHTAAVFGRAIVMPNLDPPVRTSADAASYRERILDSLEGEADFEPLMTIYLTDETDAADLTAGHEKGIVTAAKLYPAGATTTPTRVSPTSNGSCRCWKRWPARASRSSFMER